MSDPKGAVEAAYQRVLAYLASEEALRGHRLAYQHVAAVRQIRDQHLAELGGALAASEERSEGDTAPLFEGEVPFPVGEGEQETARAKRSSAVSRAGTSSWSLMTTDSQRRRTTVAGERRSRRSPEERRSSDR
jgi:hypothetical protein